ncbi:MAG: glycoside hydrolase family 16 protein [Ktedonobacteraceae bacterium]|nr:glycoside hydrolase family 16 protein [Ktedonobacteraceae bacterium]
MNVFTHNGVSISGDTLWTSIFDDEFDEASLNTGVWNIEDYGTDRYQNCCLKFGAQYFTAQDSSLDQGHLRFTTENRSLGGRQYTSGAITTENKFSFLYGRVDISARMPRGQGMWPALWMITGNIDHEINIMEMANDPTIAYQTFHMNIPTYNTYVFQCISHQPDLSADFHLYSLIWYPTSLAWYVDGIPTCHIAQYVPQTPMYLLLDTAVGGPWPGLPDATTVFPQYTDIDYIRVYQTAPYTTCSGLQVTTPLQMIQTSVARGTIATAKATYTNTCTVPFVLNNLIVASRTSTGSNADFGNKAGAVTLQPGQSVTVNASRLIKTTDPVGQWDAFTSFQTPNGAWHPDGTNLIYFNVT